MVVAHQMLVRTQSSSGVLPTAEPIAHAASVMNSRSAISARIAMKRANGFEIFGDFTVNKR